MNASRLLSNLSGAWDVIWGRPEGLDRLDVTVEGFWRSFGAIVLVVPAVLLVMASQRASLAALGEPVPPLTGAVVGANTLALLLDWFTFPVLFALLARPLGVAGHYVQFIVARNWAAVLVAAIVGVINSASMVGFLPAALASALLAIAIGMTLWFSFNVARIALGASVGLALPIVILDILLSLTIWSVIAPPQAAG